jgi:hypothetical protein
MNPNRISTSNSINLDATAFSDYFTVTASGDVGNRISGEKGRIDAKYYFRHLKTKMGLLEGMRLKNRIKKLEKAFNAAVDNGQEALAEKFLMEVARESRESVLYAKGYKLFIEKVDAQKFKQKIRGGHISDTVFSKYTRAIPQRVLDKKKKAAPYFDEFVIYHVYQASVDEKRAKGQKMSESEKATMRDPVLFGRIRETDRLYFIAEWADDVCDLSFDELIEAIGKEDSEYTISAQPNLSTT